MVIAGLVSCGGSQKSGQESGGNDSIQVPKVRAVFEPLLK